jgi:hypothetical protein
MYVLMKEPSTLEVVSDFLDNEIYIDASPYVFYEYSNEVVRNTSVGSRLANRSPMPTLHSKVNSN